MSSWNAFATPRSISSPFVSRDLGTGTVQRWVHSAAANSVAKNLCFFSGSGNASLQYPITSLARSMTVVNIKTLGQGLIRAWDLPRRYAPGKRDPDGQRSTIELMVSMCFSVSFGAVMGDLLATAWIR